MVLTIAFMAAVTGYAAGAALTIVFMALFTGYVTADDYRVIWRICVMALVGWVALYFNVRLDDVEADVRGLESSVADLEAGGLTDFELPGVGELSGEQEYGSFCQQLALAQPDPPSSAAPCGLSSLAGARVGTE